jgi:hypothetical protein
MRRNRAAQRNAKGEPMKWRVEVSSTGDVWLVQNDYLTETLILEPHEAEILASELIAHAHKARQEKGRAPAGPPPSKALPGNRPAFPMRPLADADLVTCGDRSLLTRGELERLIYIFRAELGHSGLSLLADSLRANQKGKQ